MIDLMDSEFIQLLTQAPFAIPVIIALYMMIRQHAESEKRNDILLTKIIEIHAISQQSNTAALERQTNNIEAMNQRNVEYNEVMTRLVNNLEQIATEGINPVKQMRTKLEKVEEDVGAMLNAIEKLPVGEITDELEKVAKRLNAMERKISVLIKKHDTKPPKKEPQTNSDTDKKSEAAQ